MAASADELPTDSDQSSQPRAPKVPKYDEGSPNENGWWAEFTEQKDREDLHQKDKHSVPHAAGVQMPASANRVVREFRCKDLEQADGMWVMAQGELEAASELQKTGKWHSATWHSHQAVEMGIKSLMWRTCGITADETKGPSAHDLLGLFRHLIPNQQEWPVSHSELTTFSKGPASSVYIDARYSPFPPVANRHLPKVLFNEEHARSAEATAKRVLSWIESRDHTPMPSSTSIKRKRPA